MVMISIRMLCPWSHPRPTNQQLQLWQNDMPLAQPICRSAVVMSACRGTAPAITVLSYVHAAQIAKQSCYIMLEKEDDSSAKCASSFMCWPLKGGVQGFHQPIRPNLRAVAMWPKCVLQAKRGLQQAGALSRHPARLFADRTSSLLHLGICVLIQHCTSCYTCGGCSVQELLYRFMNMFNTVDNTSSLGW